MPIINPTNFERPALPEVILAAFRERPYLPVAELAALLMMDRRTLSAHIRRARAIPWRQKGMGRKRPRRVFTLSDVEMLFDDMTQQGEPPCQSNPPIKFRPRQTRT